LARTQQVFETWAAARQKALASAALEKPTTSARQTCAAPTTACSMVVVKGGPTSGRSWRSTFSACCWLGLALTWAIRSPAVLGM
jgi:hypothetical protein